MRVVWISARKLFEQALSHMLTVNVTMTMAETGESSTNAQFFLSVNKRKIMMLLAM